MTHTVTATYENGVLRPAAPLPLADGATVEIAVTRVVPPPTPAEEDALRRIREAKTLEELWAAIDTAPEDELPPGYDFCEALNENRRLSGDSRLLYPPELKGVTW
jgi:predicted DNA-binding antitoxin AbrB/MazE fold protein